MGIFRKEGKRTYEADIMCSNCSNEENVEIKKGMKIEAFCKNYTCPECGCRAMRKESECDC
ncbi:MAG TPA: hypothetical protein VJB11_01130 [archaeon]|nr:hypothetical protein [archaeon]